MPTLGQIINEFRQQQYSPLKDQVLARHIGKLEGRISADFMKDIQTLTVTLTDEVAYNLGVMGGVSKLLDVTVNGMRLNHTFDRDDSLGYYLSSSGDDVILNLNEAMSGYDCYVTYQVITGTLDADTDKDTTLLLPHPFDEAYVTYLQAQNYKHLREYDDYNNYMRLFDEQLTAFNKWYIKRSPKDRKHFGVNI